MADNIVASAAIGVGATFASDDIAGVQFPRSKLVWGSDGTATDASAAAPLPVAQTGAIPAGANNIGDVDVLTLPALVAGTANIGDVDVLTLPALPAGTNNIGDVDILSIAAGDNNIGNVDVLTIPALVAGTANIGDVDVLTLPALVAGTANIGDVDVLTIAAGDNNIGNVDVLTLPALVAGTANIGDVDVLTLPAIPTGTNTIGNVGAVATTTGGCSVSSFLSTAAVQSTAVKASAGQVYSLQFFNLNAAARYVRLYNQTTAPATTDTANIVWRGMIPGNTAGAGFVAEFPNGIAFATGIGIRVTAAVADNDGTALAASEIQGNVVFK